MKKYLLVFSFVFASLFAVSTFAANNANAQVCYGSVSWNDTIIDTCEAVTTSGVTTCQSTSHQESASQLCGSISQNLCTGEVKTRVQKCILQNGACNVVDTFEPPAYDSSQGCLWCGDGKCTASIGEDTNTCPIDCPAPPDPCEVDPTLPECNTNPGYGSCGSCAPLAGCSDQYVRCAPDGSAVCDPTGCGYNPPSAPDCDMSFQWSGNIEVNVGETVTVPLRWRVFRPFLDTSYNGCVNWPPAGVKPIFSGNTGVAKIVPSQYCHTNTLYDGQTITVPTKITGVAVGTTSAYAFGNVEGPGGNGSCKAQKGISVTAVQKYADLSVLKHTLDTTPNAGEQITFQIVVSNTGPDTADNVIVHEPLSENYEYVTSGASQGTYDPNTGIWTVGTMTSGATETLSVYVKVLNAVETTNTVVVSDDSTVDENPNNDTDSVTVTPNAGSDLSIAKTVSNSTPELNSEITFDIVVTNNGPESTGGIVVEDILDANYFAYVTHTSPDGDYNPTTGQWVITSTLAANETATLSITVKVISENPTTNTVTIIDSDNYDPDDTNNEDNVPVDASPVSDLEVIKTIIDSFAFPNPTNNKVVSVGDEVIFRVSVTNNGPDDAYNINLSDTYSSNIMSYVNHYIDFGPIDPSDSCWVELNSYSAYDACSGGYQSADINCSDGFNTVVGNTGECKADWSLESRDLCTKRSTCPGFDGSFDPSTGIWSVGYLPANTTMQLYLVVKIDAEGQGTNTATVTNSDSNDPDETNNTDTVTVDAKNCVNCNYAVYSFWGPVIESFTGGVRYESYDPNTQTRSILSTTDKGVTDNAVCSLTTLPETPVSVPTLTALCDNPVENGLLFSSVNTSTVAAGNGFAKVFVANKSDSCTYSVGAASYKANWTDLSTNMPTYSEVENFNIEDSSTATLYPGGTAYFYVQVPFNLGADQCVGAVPSDEIFPNEPNSTGFQGCTIGFWHKPENWDAYVPNFSPYQTLDSVFEIPVEFSFGSETLISILPGQPNHFKGGPTVEDKAKLLVKQAVGALANADSQDYHYTVEEVIALTNEALASLSSNVILDQKDDFDHYNNIAKYGGECSYSAAK